MILIILDTLVNRHPPPINADQFFARIHTGDDFEREVASLYKDLGYNVTRQGGPHDHGIDLTIINQEGRRYLVQCKNWNKPVGPDVIRELYGVISGKNVAGGILVTREASQAAWNEARRKTKLQIVDRHEIAKLVVKARPPVPSPPNTMTDLDKSTQAQVAYTSTILHTATWYSYIIWIIGICIVGILTICVAAIIGVALWPGITSRPPISPPIKPIISQPDGLSIAMVKSVISTEIDRIGGQQPLRPTAGDNGRFIVVTVKITNRTGQMLELVPSSYILTSAGYQFAPDPFASTESQDGGDFYCGMLQNGGASTRIVAFDVPIDIAMRSATLIVYGDAAHIIKAEILVQ